MLKQLFKNTRILLSLFFAGLILAASFSYIYFTSSNKIILDNESYYIPRYQIDYDQEDKETYYFIVAAFDKAYSLDRFFNQEWGKGLLGLYIVVKDNEIEQLLIELDTQVGSKIYTPTEFSGKYTAEEISDLKVSLDGSPKLELFLKNINLEKAQELNLKQTFLNKMNEKAN